MCAYVRARTLSPLLSLLPWTCVVMKPNLAWNYIAPLSTIRTFSWGLRIIKLVMGQLLPNTALGTPWSCYVVYVCIVFICVSVLADFIICYSDFSNYIFLFCPGQNPFFDESFTFFVNFPEMAIVRFNILDDDFIGDEFIAQYSILFSCMQSGRWLVNASSPLITE